MRLATRVGVASSNRRGQSLQEVDAVVDLINRWIPLIEVAGKDPAGKVGGGSGPPATSSQTIIWFLEGTIVGRVGDEAVNGGISSRQLLCEIAEELDGVSSVGSPAEPAMVANVQIGVGVRQLVEVVERDMKCPDSKRRSAKY